MCDLRRGIWGGRPRRGEVGGGVYEGELGWWWLGMRVAGFFRGGGGQMSLHDVLVQVRCVTESCQLETF